MVRIRTALVAAAILASMLVATASTAPTAQANPRCEHTNHTHWHVPYAHTDQYNWSSHQHRDSTSFYETFHVPQHNTYLSKICYS